MDIPFTGPRFTWKGRTHTGHPVESKLDRGFMTEGFLDYWDMVSGQVLARTVSDHHPQFCCRSTDASGPKPFRFFHMWIRDPGFLEFVRYSWRQPIGTSEPWARLRGKLKRLKANLKDWNRNVCGHISRQKEGQRS